MSHADKVVQVPRCSHDVHSTCVEFASRGTVLIFDVLSLVM